MLFHDFRRVFSSEEIPVAKILISPYLEAVRIDHVDVEVWRRGEVTECKETECSKPISSVIRKTRTQPGAPVEQRIIVLMIWISA